MDKLNSLTAASVLDSLQRSPNSDLTIASPGVPGAPGTHMQSVGLAGVGSLKDRFMAGRAVQKALDKYRPVVAEAQARVAAATALDIVDAANDQRAYHVIARRTEHGERIAAATQAHDECLIRVEESGQDRWTQAESARIVQLALQREQGALSEAAFRRAVADTTSRYARMRERLSSRVDRLIQGTDDRVNFVGNGTK